MVKTKVPFEYWISLLYIIIGALWILFSDKLVIEITKDPERIHALSTYKGWLYVAITGAFLFVLIRKEINKRNCLYDELLAANKKALESERFKTAFLSNLSHYIRTPMNSILGFVELMQNRNLNEEKRIRFLALINEKSNHLLQTINNIVEISKIQESQIEIENNKVEINEMLKRLKMSFDPDLQSKGDSIDFYLTLPLETGKDRIYSDYGKIYHILSNLVMNALNFTEKGEIEIGYKCTDGFMVFFVRDTGKGIPQSKHTALFKNFMGTTADFKELSEGSGLGLYLSYHLAKLLGGGLWIEYSNEKGSYLCFKVPIDQING
jgi:signal transduction histidine kinase